MSVLSRARLCCERRILPWVEGGCAGILALDNTFLYQYFKQCLPKKAFLGSGALNTLARAHVHSYSSSGLYDLNKASPLSALEIGWKMFTGSG